MSIRKKINRHLWNNKIGIIDGYNFDLGNYFQLEVSQTEATEVIVFSVHAN